jgi:hypothetical protein
MDHYRYVDAQTFFWRPITQDYWTVLALMAAFGAVFLFRNMVHEAAFRKRLGRPTIDGVMVARLGLLGGMILIAFSRFNSAAQAWALASFVFSGLWFGIMLETNWCHRRGTPWEKIKEIACEYGRRLFQHRAVR